MSLLLLERIFVGSNFESCGIFPHCTLHGKREKGCFILNSSQVRRILRGSLRELEVYPLKLGGIEETDFCPMPQNFRGKAVAGASGKETEGSTSVS